MAIDADFILTTLRDLIRIDSRNPRLEEGAPGEWELARHLESLLRGLEWEVELHDLGDRRANVVATRRGSGSGPSLMINVHMDTVGVAGMTDPFSGEARDGRIWGRGSQDTKGGMAAVIGVARALAEEDADLAGDVVLAFVADEENESIGTAALVERVETDSAIVIEPSELDVCIAHRGVGVFRLRTHGRTAHGGRPDLGIDANLHMGHVLVELDRLQQSWRADGPQHALLGAATLHAPLVSGGRQLFIYAGECTADLECRTVPGQSEADVLGELQSVLDSLAQRIPGFHGTVECSLWRSPYEIDPERPIVRAVMAEVEAVRQSPPRTVGHGWWEDSALLGEAGIDAVVVGPTGGGLHTEEEWVEADSVVDLAEVLYRTTVSFCGVGSQR